MKPLHFFSLLLAALIAVACDSSDSAGSDTSSDTDTQLQPVEHDSDEPLPLDASGEIPGGLPSDEIPMFVSLGFDDNGLSGLPGSGSEGGMKWILDFTKDLKNPDDTPVRCSFFATSKYAMVDVYESPTYVKQIWHRAYAEGHELGNHTRSHPHGNTIDLAEWIENMQVCNDYLTRPFDPDEDPEFPNEASGAGVDPADIQGFRTPYLEYNDETFQALATTDMIYDCSIEDGIQEGFNGTNFHWPYSLANGTPANDTIGSYPGLFEMPVYPVIAPPDYRCAEYGLEPGFRMRLAQRYSSFDRSSGKITGLDYNMWYSYKMSKEEFLATLKYSLDLRIKGNRAPMLFGGHTDEYSTEKGDFENATVRERQEAIEEFIQYALSFPQVRVVPHKAALDWVRNPAPLSAL